MSKELNGNTTLSINNAPLPKKTEKLGLIEDNNTQIKSFSLPPVTIAQLDEIVERLTEEMAKNLGMDNFKFSHSKVIQLLINWAKDKSLNDLLEKS